jgi:hypothetical protein
METAMLTLATVVSDHSERSRRYLFTPVANGQTWDVVVTTGPDHVITYEVPSPHGLLPGQALAWSVSRFIQKK